MTGKSLAVFLAFYVLLTSCTSTTLISSSPPNAELYINGEYKGETPVAYSDKKVIFSSNTVLIKKTGYEDLNTTFSRNENLHVGALIGGIFFYFPFLWVLGYKPQHHYKLSGMEGKEIQVTISEKEKSKNDNEKKLRQLKEWKSLYDSGAITKEEYQLQKEKILSE